MERASTVEVQREWLRAAEATRLTGLGRTKLWELSSRNEIKTAKVGRAVRYNRASLVEFMERMSQTDEEVEM